MPCSDGGPSLSSSYELQQRLDEVTQNLCFLCGEAEFQGVFYKLTQNNIRLEDWWEKHQENDTKRVREEMEKSGSTNPNKLAYNFLIKALKVHPVSQFHVEWFNKLAEEVCEKKKEDARMIKLKKDVLASLTEEQRKALGF